MFSRVTPFLLRTLALATLLIGLLSRFVPVDFQMFAVVSAQEPSPTEVGFVPLLGDPSSRVAVGPLAVGNMTYHGGPVQHNQKVFTIFWDPSGTGYAAGYQTTINQFVQDLNGSPYYAIASQYGDTTSNISTAVSFGGTWHDIINTIPNDPPTTLDLQNEVARAIAANGWTATADTYFQVYTPSGIGTSTNYCGYHVTTSQPFGLILYPASHGSLGTCLPGGPYPHGGTGATDMAINVSAHEIMETVTDPQFTGWYFVNGTGEIGDLCNFNFGPRGIDGSDITLNGHPYLVQQEWSNAISGCALSFTPPSVDVTANGSAGPLTLHAGSSLTIAVAADGGTSGFANPSDLYIGVSTPFGVLFLSPTGFTPTVTVLLHGPLPSFGPVTLLTIPNVSALPTGTYQWFIIVTGATGTFFDVVQTDIMP